MHVDVSGLNAEEAAALLAAMKAHLPMFRCQGIVHVKDGDVSRPLIGTCLCTDEQHRIAWVYGTELTAPWPDRRLQKRKKKPKWK